MSLSTDDIVAIQQLLARYTKSADIDSPETMRDIFTADGSLIVETMDLNISGIDNIVEFFTQSRANSAGDVYHVTSNLIVDGSGDSATSSSYLNVMHSGKEVKQMALGRHIDVLVKTAEGWRIKSRSIIF